MIETKGTTLDGNAKPTKRQMEGFLQTEGWRKALAKIQHLKITMSLSHTLIGLWTFRSY